MISDLTTRQKVQAPATMEPKPKVETEVPKEETPTEILGTEEPQQDSSTEKPAEETVEAKEDELTTIKKALDLAKSESEHIKSAMQKRIDELTWQIKSIKEQQTEKKEKTWDDLNSTELRPYIKHYVDEGNGEMVAFLTELLADKKIEERLSKQDSKHVTEATRVQTWTAVTKEYPELQDVNSEHYQRTLKLVQSDKRFDDIVNFPEGHSIAARLVAEQILKEKLHNKATEEKVVTKQARDAALKTSLDTSTGRRVERSSPSDIFRKMEEASDDKQPYGVKWKEILKDLNKKSGVGKG